MIKLKVNEFENADDDDPLFQFTHFHGQWNETEKRWKKITSVKLEYT